MCVCMWNQDQGRFRSRRREDGSLVEAYVGAKLVPEHLAVVRGQILTSLAAAAAVYPPAIISLSS